MTEFQEYKQHIENFHSNACDVMRSKAQDYTGGIDPLLNFYNASGMAGITVEQGLIYMMAIKLTRARMLTEQGSLVGKVGEKLADTLGDLSNYAGILDYFTSINYNSEIVNQLKLPFDDKQNFYVESEFKDSDLLPPKDESKLDNRSWFEKFMGI